MLFIILLLYEVSWSSACFSSGTKDLSESEEQLVKKPKNLKMLPNDTSNWNGWPAPKGAVNSWNDWINNYQKEAKEKGGYFDFNSNSTEKPYGHNIPGFPKDWLDLGAPFTGVAPPPWAYVPKRVGKPSLCYEPPDKGNCSESQIRYGYNPFTNKCQEFHYTGCEGNRNNFKDILNCENSCINPSVSGCDPDSHIPIDYFLDSLGRRLLH